MIFMIRERNEPHPYILTVLILGMFGGGFGMYYFGSRTFILIDIIVLILLIGGILALGIHYLFFRKWQRYLIEILLYSFLGWGSILCATFLTLNFLLHKTPEVKKFELKGGKAINISEYYIYDGKGMFFAGPVKIKVDSKIFEDYPWMLSFEADEIKSSEIVTEAWFTLTDGFFGYKILLKKELL